jgi:hypothetical protein
VTTAPVLAQAWRVRPSRPGWLVCWPCSMCGAFILPTRAPRGELLAATSTSDVVDALLALLAVPGDQLLTGDPDDLESSRRGARNTHDGDRRFDRLVRGRAAREAAPIASRSGCSWLVD